MAGESASTRRLLLDVPSKAPALGFPERARALAEIVLDSDPRFAIGIFGGWGSGKTTLMEALRTQIEPDPGGKALSVWFNAWRYEKEEHLIVPLLDTVREALLAWSDEQQGEEAKLGRKTARTVGRVVTSILAGTSLKAGLPGAVELSFDANKALAEARRVPEEEVPRSPYHGSFAALSSAFQTFAGKETDRRIVVFVDDLDRCLPERALDVLESMKLFFDLDGFVFVVGLDRSVVQEVIETKYRRRDDAAEAEGGVRQWVSGEEYVKKIFQLPFPLPPVPLTDLPVFLEAAYEEAGLPGEQRAELQRDVEPHLPHLVGASGVNPREVKRYINAYTLQTKIDSTLAPGPLLAAQTIAFRSDWDPVENALLEYRGLFTEACSNLRGNPNALTDLDPELVGIPDDFLEYVQEGPGAALLSTPDLDRYLATGQTSRSLSDTRLLDAIRALGESRRELRDASTNKALSRDALKTISGRLSPLTAVADRPSVLGGLIGDDYREFQRRAAALDTRLGNTPVAWEDISGDVTILEEVARRAAKRLLRLYRSPEAADAGDGAAKSSLAAS